MSHAFKFCLVVIGAMAAGHQALAQCFVCSDGAFNTAIGTYSLAINTGGGNTALGYAALNGNTTGGNNTATGYATLNNNTTGTANTASGYGALQENMTGSYSTAIGAYALGVNSTGGYDTAIGAYALPDNTSGTGNTAFGYAGLRSNTTGNNNISIGYQSLYYNATGSNNIAMGYQAAYNVANGSNNIEIGNSGAGSDTGLIRIGVQGTQSTTFIAGISGTQVTGAAVYVTSSGQLGVLASSDRYKTDIASMDPISEKLQRLRPVTFKLKADPNGVLQYGLIAEEVAKLYPELVIRDAQGVIQGVRYEELSPMLLNEAQQQQRTSARQRDRQVQMERELRGTQQQLIAMRQQIADLKQQNLSMQAAIATLLAGGERVAMR
jgi:Chaperone of endosialidase